MRGRGNLEKPANDVGKRGARSGGVGSFASANGTRLTVTATGSLDVTLLPDATAAALPLVSRLRS